MHRESESYDSAAEKYQKIYEEVSFSELVVFRDDPGDVGFGGKDKVRVPDLKCAVINYVSRRTFLNDIVGYVSGSGFRWIVGSHHVPVHYLVADGNYTWQDIGSLGKHHDIIYKIFVCGLAHGGQNQIGLDRIYQHIVTGHSAVNLVLEILFQGRVDDEISGNE